MGLPEERVERIAAEVHAESATDVAGPGSGMAGPSW